MTEKRRIVRIFLASPGDLTKERLASKEVVDEFNSQLAGHFGCHIELMGWEDTLPSFGRPQELINQDLERCELFVGMMWMRWGTPPDKEGKYSSGFEEEFDLSVKRRRETEKPEITMFFKEIEKDRLIDPGPDLVKVIRFKDKLIGEKEILFDTFQDEITFEKKLRRTIQGYVKRIYELEKSDQDYEDHTKSKKPNLNSNLGSNKKLPDLFSTKGRTFLFDFLKKTESVEGLKQISPLEVARFRLLANILSQSGNDSPSLGVHDANIIFSNRKVVDFGE